MERVDKPASGLAGSAASIPSAEWVDAADLTGVAWPLGGYAPGNYLGRCRTCGKTAHNIAKRATQCLACAISAAAKQIELLDRAYRIMVWNDAKRRGMSDRAAMAEIDKRLSMIAASAMSAGTAETAQQAQGEARQRGAGTADAQTPASRNPNP